MNDPLQGQGPERELFKQVAALCHEQPQQLVLAVAVNLICNVIRQSTSTRKAAEESIDELFGRAKTLLLDKHYDPVTGLRRSVFPFTQVVRPPFHAEPNKL
jgi:hypothetical protein